MSYSPELYGLIERALRSLGSWCGLSYEVCFAERCGELDDDDDEEEHDHSIVSPQYFDDVGEFTIPLDDIIDDIFMMLDAFAGEVARINIMATDAHEGEIPSIDEAASVLAFASNLFAEEKPTFSELMAALELVSWLSGDEKRSLKSVAMAMASSLRIRHVQQGLARRRPLVASMGRGFK